MIMTVISMSYLPAMAIQEYIVTMAVTLSLNKQELFLNKSGMVAQTGAIMTTTGISIYS